MRGIYVIVHIATGRCYVGSSVDIERRWKEHRIRLRNGTHNCHYLRRSVEAHGIEAFEFKFIEECDVSINAVRIERETFWMRALAATYNSAPAGGTVLGIKRTDEVKARMSEAQKVRYAAHGNPLAGRQRPESVRKAIGAGRDYSNRSEAHCANLSAALMGRVSPRKGVRLSDETKAKISSSKRAALLAKLTKEQ